jgi:acyl-CoA synthetase (AMP-forming)/AMP-acid ligase II/thioesterase domain-containing protein
MAPGCTPVTYDSLFRSLNEVRMTLNRAGIGRGDRVALVVPDGPDMAVASVAVAASAVCVPLNPAYRVHEYDAYLANLRASVLLVDAHLDSPARHAARHQNIPVLDLETSHDAETGFVIAPDQRRGVASDRGFAEPHDTAFVLHTSGTTERPKRVPLSHANLWYRTRRRAATLELTARDRCLNLMRLYHGSGLQNLLAVLGVGGTVVCPPGPDVDAFFDWLAEYQPTWYAAPPPVHRAILSRAADRRAILAHHSLRFIRSSSGALAPELQRQVEDTFGVPVLQAYGMTESGVVCCNPLPPRQRKPGSVGAPLNPDGAIEVATMEEAGVLTPPGILGEVVVRGPAVFEGYEDDPAANAAAFRGGWYRTGDLGMLDGDGYLFLKGRIKDLINRGGEKVSPREIEDRLAEHPSVADAAVFPLPHRTLGEDVAAAVVLRPGLGADERDLRRFVALTLADFKVPCRVLIVDGIPRSSSGKVRRQELAAHFRTRLTTPSVAPEDPLEGALARIWAEELEIDHVGAHDNFFELGGDSLRVTRMCARIQAATGHALSVATVYKSPTVAQLASVLRQEGAPTHSSSFLVPIKTDGSRPPLFCMHSRWGYADDYTRLALHLGPDQPVYGLRARGTDGGAPPDTRIEEMAAQYVGEMRRFFPQGPYLLCGYSSAGVLAWEIAQQLRAQGQRVALLAMLDATLYLNRALVPERVSALQVFRRRIRLHVDVLRELSPDSRFAYVLRRLKARGPQPMGLRPAAAEVERESRQSPALRAFLQMHREARRAYLPRPYQGPITVILSRQPGVDLRRDPRLPGRLAAGPVEIHEVPGDHATFLKEPHVQVLADVLRGCIERAIGPERGINDPKRTWGAVAFLSRARPRKRIPQPPLRVP